QQRQYQGRTHTRSCNDVSYCREKKHSVSAFSAFDLLNIFFIVQCLFVPSGYIREASHLQLVAEQERGGKVA
ncbi:unnamed protein product, partial [Callosobruchus maculatus]